MNDKIFTLHNGARPLSAAEGWYCYSGARGEIHRQAAWVSRHMPLRVRYCPGSAHSSLLRHPDGVRYLTLSISQMP